MKPDFWDSALCIDDDMVDMINKCNVSVLVVDEITIITQTIWALRGGWPRWLNWMRRPTRDQGVAGSTPAEVGNILSWRLIMKYFLRSFSPFR